MRLHIILLALSMLSGELFGQHIYTPAQKKSSKILALDISVLQGNAPLYVLSGDLISESLVTTVGAGVNYQTDFLGKMFWNIGIRVFSVSSDFDLAPMGGDQENLVSRSSFTSIPLNIGTYTQLDKVRIEFSVGFEYGRMIAQKEQNISTTKLIIVEQEIVDINQNAVQKNNAQFVATLLLSSPISKRFSSYLAVDAHHGFSDLDTSARIQKVNRLEFRMGVRYGW